ncbi:hypothetical protein O0L34_g8277 [Tuta absoluta]|nr:hypothetical protein O0L34_g8277 [Tuta absoluta]
MTVAFNRMEFKPVGKFKTKVEESVYNYDTRTYKKEYIALPTDYGEDQVTFQKAMKVTILMGQMFGLFPVLGICGDDVTAIREGLKPSVICDTPTDRRLLSGYEHVLYYIFSISFLLLRSLMMSLMAARVNSKSVETAHALYDVPTDHFDDEVQRFIDQVEVVAPAPNTSNQATFQKALRLCVLLGQCFGLNPVLGINEADTTKLRFSVVSVRFIYTIVTIVGQCWVVLMCLMRTAKEPNPSLGTNSNLVFYGINTITSFLFLRIATKWPKLCQQIAKLEEIDPIVDISVVKRCNMSCIIVLSAALFEHLLSDFTAVLAAMECDPDYPIFDAYSRGSFGWAWAFFDYNRIVSVLGFLLNIQSTFNWNFADVFVICISWYLTARLKQVNDRIGAVRGKYVSGDFWCKMREDYCRTTNLVRKVDNVISSVIFISFAINLFFICLQFLHILEEGMKPTAYCGKSLSSRPMKGFERPLYLLFSFGLLLARYISVSLIAAQVHTASKLPVLSLYDVPSSCYCVEVQRFIDQVHGDTVALSGLQFFYVKRGLLLTVAGTIVTYELVLMQFTGVNPTTPPPLSSLLYLPADVASDVVVATTETAQ